MAEIKKTEKPEKPKTPEWPPNTFSAKMKDLITEYEDVLVENLEKSETIDCQPLEVKLKANTGKPTEA